MLLKAMPVHLSPFRVEVVSRHDAFAGLRDEWNSLVSRTDDQIFYRHEFIATWLNHFSRGKLCVLLLRDDSDCLVAALPLLRQWSLVHGLPVRQLRSAANLHSARFDLIAENPEQASLEFLDFLARRRDCDALILTDLPRNGRSRALEQAASKKGFLAGRWPGMQSPCLQLPSTWSELEGQLTSRFRANLRRRRKGLEALGTVRAKRFSDSAALVTAGIALELRGWKGRAGTAMAQDAATLGFYTDLACVLAAQDQLALWALYLDDHLIAFQYGIEYRGCYALLKPAYDENFARFSPGQLLMAEVLRNSITRKLDRIDFLGEDMPWKQDWNTTACAQDWLFVFRNNHYGRILRALKFGLIPKVRQWTWSKTP